MANKKQVIHPQQRSDMPFSAGVICDGWLYISGMAAVDLATGKATPGTIEEETRMTLNHIGQILTAAGCTFDDVIKCTCHLSDIRDFAAFNGVYTEFFSGIRPARTTVQSVLGLGIKVEIDCVARVP